MVFGFISELQLLRAIWKTMLRMRNLPKGSFSWVLRTLFQSGLWIFHFIHIKPFNDSIFWIIIIFDLNLMIIKFVTLVWNFIWSWNALGILTWSVRIIKTLRILDRFFIDSFKLHSFNLVIYFVSFHLRVLISC